MGALNDLLDYLMAHAFQTLGALVVLYVLLPSPSDMRDWWRGRRARR